MSTKKQQKKHMLLHWFDLYSLCGRAPSVRDVSTLYSDTTCKQCRALLGKR